MPQKDRDFESALRRAATRYRITISVDPASPKAADATRRLLKLAFNFRITCPYKEFVAGIKKSLSIKSDSRVEEILAAVKFSCQRSLVINGVRKRIVDLPKGTPCPTITAMAKAHSMLISKHRARQLLGRRILRNALEGKVSDPSKSSRAKSAITFSLTELKDETNSQFLLLLSLLLSFGKEGNGRAEQMAKIVETGGSLDLQLRGTFRQMRSPNPALASQMRNKSSQSMLQDAPSQSTFADDLSFKEQMASERRNLLEARRQRIQIRDSLMSSITNDAAGRVFTSRGSVADMMQSITAAWEGPDQVAYADVVAADSDDALQQFCAALDILKKDLDEKRIGILVFPKDPVGAVEERLMTRAGEWVVEDMMRVNGVAICDQLHHQYPNLPRHAIEECVRDALKSLRSKLKQEPSGAEVVMIAEKVLRNLKPSIGAAASLEDARQQILRIFPRLEGTTANSAIANAANRLREKYRFEPGVDSIVWEARRSLKGGRK